jgi:hypothetical protein
MPPKVTRNSKLKNLGRYFVPSVKILEQTETSTVFRAVGVPFGGPEWLGGKDLHNEFFDRTKTDLGKDSNGEVIVKNIYAYYDHALNDSIGMDRIGYAKFYQETDQGQIWDIEVQRAYRYHDMLLTLAQKGLLGASSQPVQTSVEIDWESGLIKQWHPVEISLTPSPANPNAVVDVVKSLGIDLEQFLLDHAIVKNEGDEPEADEPPPAEPPAPAPTPDPAPEPPPAEPPAPEPPADEPPPAPTSLADEIEEMFEDGDDEDEEEAEGEGEPAPAKRTGITLDDLVKEMLKQLEPTIKAVVDTALASALAPTNEKITATATEVVNLREGIKTFSKRVAGELKVLNNSSIDLRSEVERDADEEATKQKTLGIPQGAPGKRKDK